MADVEQSTPSFVTAHVELTGIHKLSMQAVAAVPEGLQTAPVSEAGSQVTIPEAAEAVALEASIAPEASSLAALPAGEGRTDAAWASRLQTRLDDLRKLFGLPADEMVMDDFHCALQKKLLLQGRMYVFERTVCFHCNLFGYTKDKVIPLEEVTSVRKRKNYGFPNSIEIIWRGKKEFFTSFLSREDAYRLIMCAWHQCSPIARHALETHRPSKGTGHRRSASSPVGVSPRFDGHTAFDAALAMEAPSSEGTKAKCGIHRFSWRSERHLTTGPAAKPDMGNSSGQPSARSSGDGTMSAPEDNMRTFSSDETIPAYTRDSGGYTGDSEAGSVLRMVTQSEDGFGFGDDNNSDNESDSSPDGHRWLAEDTPAPPVAPASHPLVTGTLDCSVVEFCQRFLADQAQFFIDFHESRGDKKVQFSEWRQHAPLGRVRDLQFIAPIKAVIGPSQTHCHQTQRYHLYAGEQLVFETSQVMTDIPYGDHFTVEARWDVTNLPTAPEAHPQVGVKSYVAIPFTKNTVWRRAIEKGAMDQCREAHTALMEHFRRVCKAQQPRPKRPSAMVTTSSPRQAKHVQIAGIEQVSPAGEQQEEVGAGLSEAHSTAGRTPRATHVSPARSDHSHTHGHARTPSHSRRSSHIEVARARHSPAAAQAKWLSAEGGLLVIGSPRAWMSQGRAWIRAGASSPARNGFLALAIVVIILLQVAILYEALVPGRMVGGDPPTLLTSHVQWQQHVTQLQQELAKLQQQMLGLSAKLAHSAEQLASSCPSQP